MSEVTNIKLGSMLPGPVTLPCGYIDEKGTLHDTVDLRELTGEEEDLITNPKLSGADKLGRMIGNCVLRLGAITEPAKIQAAVPKMTIGDRSLLFMLLRVVSLGNDYSFEANCANCGARHAYKVDLNDLDITMMPDKKVREKSLDLPSGKKAAVRMMTGDDEAKLGRLTKEKDVLSLAILMRLKTLNGKDKISLSDVKALGLRDRNFIRDSYESFEGSIDLDIEVSCPGCRSEFKTTIDVGQRGFFLPRGQESRKV